MIWLSNYHLKQRSDLLPHTLRPSYPSNIDSRFSNAEIKRQWSIDAGWYYLSAATQVEVVSVLALFPSGLGWSQVQTATKNLCNVANWENRRLFSNNFEIILVAPVLINFPLLDGQCRSKGRGQGGPCPPSFFSYKVKTDLYKMLKIRYQATAYELFNKRPADEVYVCL